MKTSRKNLDFHRGVLEQAGLGEVAYFLKKARQNIEYARFALDHTDFERASLILSDALELSEGIDNKIIEMRVKLDDAERTAALLAEESEEKLQEEDNVIQEDR